MASGLSNSADITRNDNEGGFIKAENDVTKAFYPRIVKICDDQAQCSTGETTNVGTNESSQANIPTRSEHGQKFDVFLSHSGKQKNFVRQLHRDLMNHGMYCFYDEDPESLRVGEDFPPRIFEAAKTCDLAVFLLSKEFLESKWPMLELSACVEARKSNPNLKLLPLFFMIPPEALKQMKADNGKWKEIGISEKEQTKWHEDLKAIRRINGLKLSEGGNEMEFRDKIVKEICRKLPTYSKRYHVPCMEGEERMCQEVAELFNTVQTNEKGIRIAGLHGIAGHGKTKLGKAFCNFKLKDFEGKVCHLEFSRGDPFQRVKHALQCLTHSPQSHLQTLTIEDQAQVELYKRVKGQRVLLVLDNITEESIREVTYYVQADFWENSCILLIARSVDFLVNHFEIESQSCMRVPSLEEDEAIRILLERTSLGESTLGAEDRSFALKCAKRCLFKEISCDNVRRGRTFHPLALKAFGGHLSGKWGSNLPKWVGEIDGLVDRSGYGLGDVMTVLSTAFDNMCPAYRTIFMLLTVYMLPNMSPNKVTEWLAMNCNQEISFIEKAVKDLCKKAFIEEFEPEIRIHDLYIEFAQSKANEMGRWLWWKGDQRSTRGFGSQDNRGFELVKLEQCKYRNPSQIPPRCLQNILVLQLVDVQVRNRGKLDLGGMNSLRSITLHNCADLEAIEGMKNLLELAWLQISEVHPMFKLPELSSLLGLQHLEIDIAVSQVFCLGDLTFCFNLREIKVRCRSLMEFPRLTGLPHLEKVEFSVCVKVKGPLDCTDCVELQSVVLDSCCEMDASPLLAGCKKLSKVALSECDAVTACPDIDVPSALKSLELFISSKAASAPKCLESCDEVENLQLWNMGELKQLPSFRRLSNLTVLKLGKCGITEPPDLACCVMLEHVCFSTLNNLERFPNFSSLRKLKILSLYNCRKVQDPPDIVGCHELQVFNLLYNDNLKGLPKMDGCPRLEQIKMSWKCEDEVIYDGIDPDNWEVDDDDDSWLEHFKDEIFHFREFPKALKEWEWLKGKTMLAKKYFRGVKVYYSVTAPYETSRRSKFNSQNSITLRLRDNKVTAFPTPGRVVEDPVWLSKVQEYFGGEEDNSPISTAREALGFGDTILPEPRQFYNSWHQYFQSLYLRISAQYEALPVSARSVTLQDLYGQMYEDLRIFHPIVSLHPTDPSLYQRITPWFETFQSLYLPVSARSVTLQNLYRQMSARYEDLRISARNERLRTRGIFALPVSAWYEHLRMPAQDEALQISSLLEALRDLFLQISAQEEAFQIAVRYEALRIANQVPQHPNLISLMARLILDLIETEWRGQTTADNEKRKEFEKPERRRAQRAGSGYSPENCMLVLLVRGHAGGGESFEGGQLYAMANYISLIRRFNIDDYLQMYDFIRWDATQEMIDMAAITDRLKEGPHLYFPACLKTIMPDFNSLTSVCVDN